jgi:hypothetical protein
MKIEGKQIEKADPDLREEIERATGDEILRTIMLLGPASSDKKGETVEHEPHPNDFPSYEEYRRALIERQQRRVAHDVGDTLRQLQQLSLSITGGEISRTVIVEGPARRILEALKLPGVRHAILDRIVRLTAPRPQGWRPPKTRTALG